MSGFRVSVRKVLESVAAGLILAFTLYLIRTSSPKWFQSFAKAVATAGRHAGLPINVPAWVVVLALGAIAVGIVLSVSHALRKFGGRSKLSRELEEVGLDAPTTEPAQLQMAILAALGQRDSQMMREEQLVRGLSSTVLAVRTALEYLQRREMVNLEESWDGLHVILAHKGREWLVRRGAN